jgi:hypothetical protein
LVAAVWVTGPVVMELVVSRMPEIIPVTSWSWAVSAVEETSDIEYLKPIALNSGVTSGCDSQASPRYGLEPPPMPRYTSLFGSASAPAYGARSASGKV